MTSNNKNTGIIIAIAACAFAMPAGCAMPDRQPQAQVARADEQQCFHAGMVNGFTPAGRDTVRITVGARTVYELKTSGYCPQVDWSREIQVRPTGGSDWVCRGLDAELLVASAISGGGFDRCPVISVTRLSPEEVSESDRR